MRAYPWLPLVAAGLTLGACEQSSIALSGPTVERLWLGPDVVADPEEITALALLSADPVVLEASAATGYHQAAAALDAFGVGILHDPATSFLNLELSLGSLHPTSTPPNDSSWGHADAALVSGVLDLYRDHAAMTLFRVDRNTLGPLTQPNGS